MNRIYQVKMPRKIGKIVRDLPDNARNVLTKLLDDIRENGPVQASYPNYSKIGNVTHHCHLAPKWVAVWRNEKGTYIVEVKYVGSREKAPY